MEKTRNNACTRDDRLGVGAALHMEAVGAAIGEIRVECLLADVDDGRPCSGARSNRYKVSFGAGSSDCEPVSGAVCSPERAAAASARFCCLRSRFSRFAISR
jgi:hypothetical protein